MRIAVISDIHSNLFAFEAVMRDLRRQQVDLTVFLGDLVYGGIFPCECLSLLGEVEPLVAIKGNGDAWFDDSTILPTTDLQREIHSWIRSLLNCREIEMIRSFIPSKELQIAGRSIGFYHGSPVSCTDRIYADDPDEDTAGKFDRTRYDIALVGHTHVRMDITRGTVRIVNPGAVGISNDRDVRAGWGILTIAESIDWEQRNVDYPTAKYVAEIMRSRMPHREMLAEQIQTGEPNKSLFRKT